MLILRHKLTLCYSDESNNNVPASERHLRRHQRQHYARVQAHRVNAWLLCLKHCESFTLRKFLEHSLRSSESPTGAQVPRSKSSGTFRFPGANIPRNESSTETKVLSVNFSLTGTKVQRKEKSRYLFRVRVSDMVKIRLLIIAHPIGSLLIKYPSTVVSPLSDLSALRYWPLSPTT